MTIIAGNPFPTGFVPVGIDVATFAPGNMSSQVNVERNSVQAVGPVVYAIGIAMPFLVPAGSPGNLDLVVRYNRIQVGESTAGAGFLNAGLFYGPNVAGPLIPEYNASFLVEHNCVENSDVGFLLGSIAPGGLWPTDPSTQVIDLGGGPLGSEGGNSFLNTTFDFVFAGVPTVPTTVWAKNNFFDDNNLGSDPYAAVIGDFTSGGNTPLELSNPPLQTGVMNCDDVFDGDDDD